MPTPRHPLLAAWSCSGSLLVALVLTCLLAGCRSAGVNVPPGSLARIEGRTIRFSRTVHTDLETAWRAVGTKEGLDRWFMVIAADPVEGAPYSFRSGWDGVVGEVNAPHAIQFNAGEDGFTRFELRDLGSGEIEFALIDQMSAGELPSGTSNPVGLEQPGGPGTHWVGLVAGWHGFADRFVAVLDGSSIDFDHDDMIEVYAPLVAEAAAN